MFKLGFIGVGNMGGALLKACLKQIDGNEIIIADFDENKCRTFAETYGCTVGSGEKVAETADMIFIGVKPQVAEGAMKALQPALAARSQKPLLVSMMAGVPTQRVQALSGTSCPVIRIMPNVCAAVGEAMTLACSLDATEEQIDFFRFAMAQSGKIDFIPEKLIDAGTAVQGCGPAFVCLFVEALADGGVKCGIPRAKAYEYAIQTLKGTAALLEETGRHPGEVKDSVTSPGGSTIEGVKALEEHGFRGAVMEAVERSAAKNAKLK